MSETGRVLIAVPDANRRARLRAALAGLGVDEVPGVEEALAHLREQRPDLVLAAVVPHGELAPLLEAVPTLVFGPVRETCMEALQGGAVDFLVEPFDDRELCCRVDLRLREARERRQAAEREKELLAEAHMAAEAFESRKRAEAALRESEERFRLASEAISGVVYDWDVIPDRVRRSQGLLGLLGHHPEDVDHVVGWWTQQIHPEDWEAASTSVYASLDSGEPLFSAEYRMRHRDGHWVHVWDRGLILRDETGRPVRVVGSTVDISDRKRVEEELKAASEAKDRFLATLSHELRTPLTPVLVLVSSLERDDRVPDWLRGQLNLVRRNVELESRLIDDLLDLTRVTSGKLELRRGAVDLGDVLAHALRASRPEIASKGLRLETDLHPGSLLAWADAPRLTQVFWNLLNNAVKFTPETGTITVRSRPAGRETVIEVQDTGMGIDPEVLPRIFGAFEQAGRGITRRFGGLGLGLAVSRAIIRLHGGDLTAASPGAGRGATFTIRLPAGVPEGDLDETLAGFVQSPPAFQRNLRLLLVEDHIDTAEAMADLLRDMGHEVTVARSLAEAREAAEREDGGLDLVISDLGLPDGSGLDLMRELSGRHGLPGIALSGYGMDEDIRRSREAGFTAHLTKPISLQTLQEAILQAALR
ncbi:MAG TPA: ATP-binding protein [Thermoanaerobaculia bacterium]|jgi:PAS domain S-box-containing protein|nr:ATP-binding protein [Thermoanaerobaculia bacterium]